MQSSAAEKQEPIVRFVAQFRRYGMAILFPKENQDMMLACLFTSMTLFGRPIVHRELVELSLAIKDSGHLKEVEYVSKNKVRGVLEVLKQAHCVVANDNDGTVRLSLAPGITTFKSLRDKHDQYISRYIVDHRLNVPDNLKTELIWHNDDPQYPDTIAQMDRLILHLLDACLPLKEQQKQQYLQPGMTTSNSSVCGDSMTSNDYINSSQAVKVAPALHSTSSSPSTSPLPTRPRMSSFSSTTSSQASYPQTQQQHQLSQTYSTSSGGGYVPSSSSMDDLIDRTNQLSFHSQHQQRSMNSTNNNNNSNMNSINMNMHRAYNNNTNTNNNNYNYANTNPNPQTTSNRFPPNDFGGGGIGSNRDMLLSHPASSNSSVSSASAYSGPPYSSPQATPRSMMQRPPSMDNVYPPHWMQPAPSSTVSTPQPPLSNRYSTSTTGTSNASRLSVNSICTINTGMSGGSGKYSHSSSSNASTSSASYHSYATGTLHSGGSGGGESGSGRYGTGRSTASASSSSAYNYDGGNMNHPMPIHPSRSSSHHSGHHNSPYPSPSPPRPFTPPTVYDGNNNNNNNNLPPSHSRYYSTSTTSNPVSPSHARSNMYPSHGYSSRSNPNAYPVPSSVGGSSSGSGRNLPFPPSGSSAGYPPRDDMHDEYRQAHQNRMHFENTIINSDELNEIVASLTGRLGGPGNNIGSNERRYHEENDSSMNRYQNASIPSSAIEQYRHHPSYYHSSNPPPPPPP